ncbi:hypothetical protein EHO59_06345 [Leptospira semungkisensis]|uniref:Uncharacterized protein n=1 Tax=Leptospira semungkisensis TaxID=2484985 RepID=A0A4R9G7V9_9LEPT|nr:hypothetical protein [Leptospira semungkisensis]TGK07718.1 hypothetical protein EHO59_06345 [Leptospira semungkisensis]
MKRIEIKSLAPWTYGASIVFTAILFFFLGRLSLDKIESSLADPFSSSEVFESPALFLRPHLLLKNVRFHWQKGIYVDAEKLALEAISKSGNILAFDRPESFSLKILSGEIRIPYGSLEKLINGRLLAFADSPLRKIHISPIFHKGTWKLKMSGEVKLVVWVAFEGIANMKIDSESGRILLENESLQALLNPYTKELLNTVGVSFEDLIRFPKGKGLVISGNRIFFEPFSVFPDPAVEGRIAEIKLNEETLQIGFVQEQELPLPKTNSKNYIYVLGGKLLFGGIQVHQGRILLQDKNESSPFEFSFAQYRKTLSLSEVKMEEDGSVLISMPDSSPLD